jgi:hypothetical protein
MSAGTARAVDAGMAISVVDVNVGEPALGDDA